MNELMPLIECKYSLYRVNLSTGDYFAPEVQRRVRSMDGCKCEQRKNMVRQLSAEFRCKEDITILLYKFLIEAHDCTCPKNCRKSALPANISVDIGGGFTGSLLDSEVRSRDSCGALTLARLCRRNQCYRILGQAPRCIACKQQ
jgi:hypothetical protein